MGPISSILLATYVSQRFGGAPTLRPQDWQSGETVRVVRTIAPFGHGEEFAKETLATLAAAGCKVEQT